MQIYYLLDTQGFEVSYTNDYEHIFIFVATRKSNTKQCNNKQTNVELTMSVLIILKMILLTIMRLTIILINKKMQTIIITLTIIIQQ